MILRRIVANSPPPRLKWWGNAFYRVWANREQLVVVLRVPWWSYRYLIDVAGAAPAQLCISWRQGEGWRSGWKTA